MTLIRDERIAKPNSQTNQNSYNMHETYCSIKKKKCFAHNMRVLISLWIDKVNKMLFFHVNFEMFATFFTQKY